MQSEAAEILKDENMIAFNVINNPLVPSEGRQLFKRAFDSKNLAEMIGPLEGEWVIFHNTRHIEIADLKDITPQAGDFVTISPVLAGDDAKDIVRLIAIVALSVVAGPIAASFGYGTLGTVAIQTAITVGGTLLINAVLPPTQPSQNSIEQNDPTYGVDGPKNTDTEGVPVPIVYGEHWVAGNRVSMFTDNVDTENQYLNMLMVLSEGEIDSVNDIEINEQPIANFKDVETFVRLGTETQQPIPYFSDIITVTNKSIELPDDGSYANHTTTGPANQLRIDVVFDQGLGWYRKGKFIQTTMEFEIAYRETGTSGAWTPIPGGQTILGRNPLYSSGGVISVTRASTTPIRLSYYSDGTLDPAKRYDIRYRANEAYDVPEGIVQHIVLTDINEIQFDDIAYKHTALLGMRVRVSDQLNSVPNIRARVRGKKIKTYDPVVGWTPEIWTDNPAWIAWDIQNNTRYGGNIPDEDMDGGTLDYLEWAEFCESDNYKFNGIFAKNETLWDAMALIFKTGRAQITRRGRAYVPITKVPRSRVQLFGMGNIKKSSLNISWMPIEDRTNELTVTYYDADDYNKKTSIVVQDENAISSGRPVVSGEVEMKGVTDRDQAARFGMFALNMNTLQQTATFEAPLNAISCTIGEVVGVQHDMPQFGFGGLLEPGNTLNTLKLDKLVTIESAKTYQAMVVHDVISLWSGNTSAIVGTKITLTGFDPANYTESRIKRLTEVTSGSDLKITGTWDEGANKGVYVESAMGLIGGAVEVKDTDYIETIDVVANVGDTDTLTLQSNLEAVPKELSAWAFGETTKIVKDYEIIGITGTGENWRTITALEYNPAALGDALAAPVDPITPLPSLISAVSDFTFEEFPTIIGKTWRSMLRVNIDAAQPQYAYSEVWVQRESNRDFILMASSAVKEAEFEVFDGEVIFIKVIPVDQYGRKPDLETLTAKQYTVTGSSPEVPFTPLNAVAFGIDHTRLRISFDPAEGNGAVPEVPQVRSDRTGVFQIYYFAGTTANFGDATLLQTFAADSFDHKGLSAQTSHTYFIVEVNSIHPGIESIPTSAIHASTPANTFVANDTANVGGNTAASVIQSINDAILAANDANNNADSKTTTYFQNTAPNAGLADGDLWVDGDADNALYRYNLGITTWVLIQDSQTALSTANLAQATADGKIKTFSQGTPPTPDGIGDFWIDTSDLNKIYRYNGSVWVSAQDGNIGTALQDAADAVIAAGEAYDKADGKIQTFWQDGPPTAEATGDLWIDTNDGNLTYRWDSATWQPIQDADIAQAILDASGAQSTADGKVALYFSASDSPPGSAALGDIWSQNDTGVVLRWNGSAWTDTIATVGAPPGTNVNGVPVDFVTNPPENYIQDPTFQHESTYWSYHRGTFQFGRGQLIPQYLKFPDGASQPAVQGAVLVRPAFWVELDSDTNHFVLTFRTLIQNYESGSFQPQIKWYQADKSTLVVTETLDTIAADIPNELRTYQTTVAKAGAKWAQVWFQFNAFDLAGVSSAAFRLTDVGLFYTGITELPGVRPSGGTANVPIVQAGVPNDTDDGKDGDTYTDPNTGQQYTKVDGAWVATASNGAPDGTPIGTANKDAVLDRGTTNVGNFIVDPYFRKTEQLGITEYWR